MWWPASFDAIAAGMEVQRVIALRLLKIARGDADARREAQTMVSEKMDAAIEAAAILAGGGSMATVMRRTRTIVRANEKRLSRTRRKRR